MEKKNLFQKKDGSWVTNKDLLETLLSMGADQCDTLYIHSSLNFGLPNRALKTKGLLAEIYDVLTALNVPTLCMPTYTFSYCNKTVYNPLESKSRMGVLNEYFRNQEGVVRSLDPLMSVAVKGKDKDLAFGISNHSISEGSTFDLIHHRDNVKFLFLGPKIGDCFTYMHYLEWLYSVDYRYIRAFKGKTVIGGMEISNEYDLFVRYNGVIANANTYVYEQMLVDAGSAIKKPFGDGMLTLVDEKSAAAMYRQLLEKDPLYFADLDVNSKVKDKTFILKGEMVAL
jgi:aminoglycoside 3-N-acetyltransferase